VVADITDVPTWSGWLYLAVVLDCFSRRVVGWAMANHLRAELVVDALDMAIWRRQPLAGLVHHSDQGCQGVFKWSSQQLGSEELRWDQASVDGLIGLSVLRCVQAQDDVDAVPDHECAARACFSDRWVSLG
jgi:putative transposase